MSGCREIHVQYQKEARENNSNNKNNSNNR